MSSRYVIQILSRNAASRPNRDLAPKSPFTTVFAHGDFKIFATPETNIQSRDAGAVVGQIYSKKDPMRPYDLASDVADPASNLVANAWGAYVFIRQNPMGAIEVLRDPSGALPVYIVALADETLIVSDLDALKACSVRLPAVDWSFLTWHLSSGYLRAPDTALIGVRELPQGCQITFNANGCALVSKWSPWSYTKWNGRTAEENARVLRTTIDQCVFAMTCDLDRMHLGLSGGLDSSILACSLKTAGRSVSAYTLVTDDNVGDERNYAAMAADAFGLDLAAIPYELDLVDLTRSVAGHLPRPVGLPYQGPLYHYWQSQTAPRSAVVTGNGGDEVFCLMQSATPSVDLWLTTRNPLLTIEALGDLMRLTGCPAWTACQYALRSWHARRLPYAWQRQTRFLASNALTDTMVRMSQSLNHPWLTPPENTLPGKKAHVANLLRLQHFVEGPPRSKGLHVLYPLLAQPVVELCLQVPSWQWSANGRSRAVARDAYQGRLPNALLNRTHKGGPEAFAAKVYLAWRARLIPFLCDGLLAANGIVDKDEMHSVLSLDAPPRGFDYLRLLELADAEAWARQH